MRVGILGGSFDPPHIGHLKISEEILSKDLVDKIYFMPAYIQPFKQNNKIITEKDAKDRLSMTKLLASTNAKFDVIDYEIKKRDISYTYESLNYLSKTQFQNDDIFFIQGEDTFLEIEKWWKAENILTEFNFIIAKRKDKKNKNSLDAFIKNIEEKYHTNIIPLENNYIDISSTKIRKLIEAENWEEVEKYIPRLIFSRLSFSFSCP